MRRALRLMGSNSREIPTTGNGSAPAPAATASSARRPGPQRKRPEGAASHSDMASHLTGKMAELEAQLASEREQHDNTRRLLREVELSARTLDIRSQQLVLAQQEELEAARQTTVAAQRALDEAVFETRQRDGLKRAPVTRRQAVPTPDTATDAVLGTAKPTLESHAPVLARSAVEPAPAKKRGRPRLHPLPEPKPVRWWTPSFRARSKG